MDKIKYITAILLFLLIITGCSSHYMANTRHIYDEYRIKKIEEHRKFYIIYASRNDSIFKIINDKEFPVSCENCEKIHKGNMYKLRLENVYKVLIEKGYLDVNISTRLNYNGEIVPIEKKCHNQLYFANNLINLYFIQDTLSNRTIVP